MLVGPVHGASTEPECDVLVLNLNKMTQLVQTHQNKRMAALVITSCAEE